MAKRKTNTPRSAATLPVIGIVGVLLGGGAGWIATMPNGEGSGNLAVATAAVADVVEAVRPEPRPYRYFAGCNDARAAGYENIDRDEPSYRPEMDGDGDGIACEPYR